MGPVTAEPPNRAWTRRVRAAGSWPSCFTPSSFFLGPGAWTTSLHGPDWLLMTSPEVRAKITGPQF